MGPSARALSEPLQIHDGLQIRTRVTMIPGCFDLQAECSHALSDEKEVQVDVCKRASKTRLGHMLSCSL